VHPDVIALVALQGEDTAVDALNARMRALEPRVQELERAKNVATEALARARQMLTADEEKLREAQTRSAAHRQLQERNQRQFDTITNVREAAAAGTQLEQSRRMASDTDAEVHRITARVSEARTRISHAELALAEMEASQETERSAIAADRRAVEEELRHARMKRDGTAKRVNGGLLTKYDKVRKRHRSDVVFPLTKAGACGNCDTALPVQRRHEMARSGTIEMCEACGVLLYAGE
jgi:predicted  nucleic acid-binding Zn-ribbon protein